MNIGTTVFSQKFQFSKKSFKTLALEPKKLDNPGPAGLIVWTHSLKVQLAAVQRKQNVNLKTFGGFFELLFCGFCTLLFGGF